MNDLLKIRTRDQRLQHHVDLLFGIGVDGKPF